ncbi:hypothetical protein [Leptospira ryugenii]|nr:hypothetical protein [Leptospira ryugenii]
MRKSIFWALHLFFSTSVWSSDLVLKDQVFVWQGLSLVFPEDVVVKEQNLSREKILQIFPARREPFFMSIRELPLSQIPDSLGEWEKEVFWQGKQVKRVERTFKESSFLCYSGEQVRNQNLLRAELCLGPIGSKFYWFWIFIRKDRADLQSYFETGSFLP